MNKKYLVLPTVLVVVAAVVAAIQLWPSPLKDLLAQNFCLGMLTENTTGLSSDGTSGRVTVDEHKTGKSGVDPAFSTIRFVNRDPEGDAAERPQYTHDTRASGALKDR
ncbi:hypothetical protein ACIBEA_06895 [Streptomyces sp. NPDC051555]|uniref:hypothetical protein n=1 Tax=Streptomyces sp. NPDC051555 TaxID=3365657 RepID=UPI00378B58AA